MRRLIFFILLVTSIVTSMCVVLFVPQFMLISTGNEFIDATQGMVSITGWDLMFNGYVGLFPTLFNGTHEFAFESDVMLQYAMALFLLISAITILILLLILLLNGLRLGRSSRLYRNVSWFFLATIILTGIYIWHAVDLINSAIEFETSLGADTPQAGWGIGTLSWAFYIPIGTALVMTILGGVLKASEPSND